jgi:hypothetical protein
MPMNTKIIGTDSEGNDVNVVWGDRLNWASGIVKLDTGQFRYYRAKGKSGAHYVVKRQDVNEFKYWYISIYINGRTMHLPTEFMNAWEGKEVCQIYESEYMRDISKERAHVRIENKNE